MWPLILSLFIASSTVSATSSPRRVVPSPDLKFSCPKTLSQSLCCSNDVQSNGAVKDCQESRYLIPNPDGDNGNAGAVDRCTASQMNAGYDTPVCCATQVRTFKFDKGAPVFIGVNCMDAEDVHVGLEKREMPAEASKTVPQELQYTKYTRISPLDHRQDVVPTTTRPHVHPMARIRGLPTAHPHAVEDVRANSAETPVSLWRPRSAKKQARRNLKRASRSKNSVANTIMNDLNSASSRAIVRNAGGPKTRRNAAAQLAGRSATKKQTQSQSQPQTRDLTGLGKLTSLLGGLSSLSKGPGSVMKRLAGIGRREAANMFARIV